MRKTTVGVTAGILGHILTLGIILTACGLMSGSVEGEGAYKFTGVLERNITLRILENDTAIKQGYLKELLDAFNAKYAEYGIHAQDANMDQYSDLENDGPYGYGPDVLYQANDRLMKYVDGKHIQPLPIEELECCGQIDQKAWDAYKAVVEGEDFYCGVPVNIQGPLLYYRKDLLPADWRTAWDDNGNGVPDMIESWNALYRFSLSKRAEGKFGYMKSLFDPYFAIGYLYSYGAYAFGKNDTDTYDVGFSKGEAEKGAGVLRQLASSMNESCIDDTVTVSAYSKIGSGDYFATMTTPDVYTMFIDELIKNGMTRAEAVENLGIADIPYLPESGDLSEINPALIPSKMMGGVNGYAISAYTKSPNAALAFVDFATNYANVKRRNELLGIVPARRDAADEAGGLSETINKNLAEGSIAVMPSIKASAQLWTPLQTFFTDVAKDPFRPVSGADGQKYRTPDSFRAALINVDKQIYDSIHALQ